MLSTRREVVRIRDLDVPVTIYGNGGRPVVLLPGGAVRCAPYFPELVEGLPDHIVVVHDRRGSGATPAGGPVTLGAWAQDTVALLDGLAIDRALFVGHSLGGALAVNLLLDHPDRVAGALLLDPTPMNNPQVCAGAARTLGVMAAASRLPVVGDPLGRALKRVSRPKSMGPSARRAFDETFTGGWLTDTAHAVRSLADDARLFCARTLSAVEVPVVLVTADRKPGHRVRVAHAQLAAALGARLEVWPKTGHNVNLQRPDLVVARTRELLAEDCG